METVCAFEGKEMFELEGGGVEKSSSELSSLDQIGNPIVYKLVRIDGDGRLVPATDDEVVEVENLLEDNKSEMFLVNDSVEGPSCTTNGKNSVENNSSNGSKGLSNSVNIDADAEKPREPQQEASNNLEDLREKYEEVVPSATSLDDILGNQSGIMECLEPSRRLSESGTSSSTVGATWKPDFTKLKGEICLDNLSVKDLHETFKATFGRETSVKDKQWLKRRIAMGLSNSCHVTTTTFIIEDKGMVKKVEVENFEDMDDTSINDPAVGAMIDNRGSISVDSNGLKENLSNVAPKDAQNATFEMTIASEDIHLEQRGAKRIRKPTRRYIEEVSEVESKENNEKLVSTLKNSENCQSSPRAIVSPQNIQSVGRPLVTRQDSLGGSGVQVPYVCRIRRGRPREDFMSFMKHQPYGNGVAGRRVKRSLGGRDIRSDDDAGSEIFKPRVLPGWDQQTLIDGPNEDEQTLNQNTESDGKDMDSMETGLSAENSDDNVVTVPTSKGRMRRKHHRPWTIGEVVKLVEGVAEYGAGRWSEIKRVAFATYSYRTSVDLKDKWRNLLRASLVQPSEEKGVQNARKHSSSIPIPAPILSRVRELADMQSQVTPDLRSFSFAGHSGRTLHDMRPGFL